MPSATACAPGSRRSSDERSPAAPVRRGLIALLPLGVALGLAAAGVAVEPTRRADAEARYVIPPGTGERARAGLSVSDVLPRIVTTRVGQMLVVQNEDTVRHTFGPFVLEPGQSWRRAFAAAGDYALDCSIYPVAGFTIAVEPAEGPLGALDRLRRVWLGATILAAMLFAGGAGLAAFGLLRPAPVAAIARILPAMAAGVALLGAAALSRLADWGLVLGSRPMIAWAAATGVALGAAAWLIRAERAGAPRRAGLLPAFTLTLAGVILALWPDLDLALAARAGFAVFGAALLVAALLVGPLGVGTGDADLDERGDRDRRAGRLAAVGLVLFLSGLPQPASTPPAVGLVALPFLALGAGLVAWAARRAGGPGEEGGWGRDGAWFAGVAGMTVVLLQTAVIWSALLDHLDAVTLPAWGNPVAVDEASIARGAALWNEACAACHAASSEAPLKSASRSIATPASTSAATSLSTTASRATPKVISRPPVASRSPAGPLPMPDTATLDDTALLELITHGHATAPGLAYELDVYARGDIVNYIRTLEDGD